MDTTELCYTPAVELARLIREKALSPVEVTEGFLERIDALNPRVNAYCTVTAEIAREAARAAEQAVMDGAALGPIHGVPVSIKDLTMTRGVRTMSGSHIFADRVPDFDAPLVTRLKEAGGIMLGKTTTPEFGWKALGDCPVSGVTRNPWNPEMTSGGSSAGAAASVAAGMGPLAQGSDGAGSIRIPSAFCGVFGIKPTYGRVPNYPISNTDSTSHPGPMTRTVADAALMLSVMAGPHEADRTSLEGVPADYSGELMRGIKGRKVGFSPDLGGLRVDAEIAEMVARAVQNFGALGCSVEEVDPAFGDPSKIIDLMWHGHEAGNYGPSLDEWRDRMDPGLVASIEDGLRHSLTDYIQMRGEKNAYCDRIRLYFEHHDLLLTPSLSVAAFPVNRLNPEHWDQHTFNWLRWASFSYPFNFSGNPAASVPIGFTQAGLPVGLQIVGPRFADLLVLQAAAAFEQAHPWAQHRPPLD